MCKAGTLWLNIYNDSCSTDGSEKHAVQMTLMSPHAMVVMVWRLQWLGIGMIDFAAFDSLPADM